MAKEDSGLRTLQDKNATKFWQREALSVLSGLRMHGLSGQLRKGPNSWRNVTEHCLVETARTEILGRWIGLPSDIISEIKVGAVLHDYSKKQEITVTKRANENKTSPLAAVEEEHDESDSILIKANFSQRIIRLADAPGGLPPQLIEVQRILDQESLSDDDWAYLIVHYVDAYTIESKWVEPARTDLNEKRVNAIDFRMQINKDNPNYGVISQEVSKMISSDPSFFGMNNIDAEAFANHQIELRLARRIKEKTGKDVDPLEITQLVDQRINDAIAA